MDDTRTNRAGLGLVSTTFRIPKSFSSLACDTIIANEGNTPFIGVVDVFIRLFDLPCLPRGLWYSITD